MRNPRLVEEKLLRRKSFFVGIEVSAADVAIVAVAVVGKLHPDSPLQDLGDENRVLVDSFHRQRRRGRLVDASKRVSPVPDRVQDVVVERHRLLPLDVVDF